jgi:DHHC palmitoyltransferase
MVELLQIGNDRNIDLENFCFYCKVIKSTRTFHCMICNRCVEKFDHHCVYINNCLGYRNHKYFLLFLVSISIYIIASVSTCFASFFTHGGDRGTLLFDYLDWIFRVYTILINLLQSIPLIYQLKEQFKKLLKEEKVERKVSHASNMVGSRTRSVRSKYAGDSRKSSATGNN